MLDIKIKLLQKQVEEKEEGKEEEEVVEEKVEQEEGEECKAKMGQQQVIMFWHQDTHSCSQASCQQIPALIRYLENELGWVGGRKWGSIRAKHFQILRTVHLLGGLPARLGV